MKLLWLLFQQVPGRLGFLTAENFGLEMGLVVLEEEEENLAVE